MIFRRTASGIANMHLFHKVDIIAYCEGGNPLSRYEIDIGQGDPHTLDVFFWQTIFSFFVTKKKIHFKSVGNKPTLISIANDVGRVEISSVLVCLDRDYDFHIQVMLNFRCVLYTFGYSWENDVFSDVVLRSLFWKFRNRNEESAALEKRMISEVGKFASSLQKYCEYDIALIARRKPGLFERCKPARALDLSGATPSLNILSLRDCLNRMGYKVGPRRIIRIDTHDVMRFALGHLVAKYIYLLFKALLKREIGNLSFDTFMRLAIAELGVAANSGRLAEYKAHISAVISAAVRPPDKSKTFLTS